MGPAPPKDAFFSEREDFPPRLVASWATGFSVPYESGESPVAYPWEVQHERWVKPYEIN